MAETVVEHLRCFGWQQGPWLNANLVMQQLYEKPVLHSDVMLAS